MATDFKITVNDLLLSTCFKRAKILAGRGGISRTVKWVHILDSPIFSSLTGNEFILSTGRMFADPTDAVELLKQIIERHVSGICIELVAYITEIPAEMIKLAEENDFPLIVFSETESFIEITRDVNTMIIAQDSMTFSLVESFSQQLNGILLSPHGIEDILSAVHNCLGTRLVYLPLSGKPIFVPGMASLEQKKYLDLFKCLDGTENALNAEVKFFGHKGAIVTRSIQSFNQKMADVYMFSMQTPLTDFELLIFDKAMLAISQDLLRGLFGKEKKNYEENKWIFDWCRGRVKDNDIIQRLSDHMISTNVTGFFVQVLKFETPSDPERSLNDFMIHTLILIRSLYEREGFSFLGTYENNKIICVILDFHTDKKWSSRVNRVVEQIKFSRNSFPKSILVSMGIGKRVKHVGEVRHSFQTAEEAIEIQKKIEQEVPIYDSLHIYRVISQFCKSGYLDEFVADYLGPVIQYDQEHHADLLKTLRVYFDCNGSKIKTAEQLFIVRQTLYLRLEKLEELLGADFMVTEKRLAIEFALNANSYVKADCNKDRGFVSRKEK